MAGLLDIGNPSLHALSPDMLKQSTSPFHHQTNPTNVLQGSLLLSEMAKFLPRETINYVFSLNGSAE